MTVNNKKVRIGGGAAHADDWLDSAVYLIEQGDIDYICLDALSEMHMSRLCISKLENPEQEGYDLRLDKRMRKIIPAAINNKVKVIANMGGIAPVMAAEYVADLARQLGFSGVKTAGLAGDDLRSFFKEHDGFYTHDNKTSVKDFGDSLVAANAYAPCYAIIQALKEGADIILTGRMGDAAPYAAIAMYEFGWEKDDWDKIATAIMCGHVCECGGQATGGNFYDAPYKTVKDTYKLGFPIAEIHENCDVYFSKSRGSGGSVTMDTIKEQILYETSDPSDYRHAEVIVDFSGIKLQEIQTDLIKMSGVKGKPAPSHLKVALCIRDGYYIDTYIWYGGPGARARGEFARELLNQRFEYLGYNPEAYAIWLMGIDGMYGNAPGVPENLEPWEVGVHFVARGRDPAELFDMAMEATGCLTTNGPSGPSGSNWAYPVRDVVKYNYLLIPRELVNIEISYKES